MDTVKLLLAIFTAVPALTHAAEEISSGFPGQGKVKKDAVLKGIGDILSLAAAFNVPVDTPTILTGVSSAIDGYVALANTAGIFAHGSAR